MSYKTIDDVVSIIGKSGADPVVIKEQVVKVFEHGFERGYTAATRDHLSRSRAKKRSMLTAFKRELDMISDVIKAKWA